MRLVNELSKHYDGLEEWNSKIVSIESKSSLKNLILSCEHDILKHDLLGIFLNFPRLHRFAIDHYCNNKTDDNRRLEEEVRHCLSESFNLEYEKTCESLKRLVINPIVKSNLSSFVYEPPDQVTLTYLYPKYIVDFFEKIRSLITDDTLLISMSRGATRAAVSIANGLNIEHLPIRLSIHKALDSWPQIRDDEFLHNVCGKRLFCFDEDCSSGITLFKFNEFLKNYGLKASYGVIATRKDPLFGKPDYYAIEF